MVLDRKQRTTKRRIDDNQRKQKVIRARGLIYEKNYAVDSKAVERILQDQSLVPTSVSSQRCKTSNAVTYSVP